MTDLKKTAQQLAAKGRHGDSMLLHVSPAEVAGLASLIPGGKLPVNPHTGLPEAFFFLPFLASLFGAAAPAAAAATAAAPAAASALGAGAAAGTAAAGTAAATGAAGAAGTGLGATLAGGPLAALGKGIGALTKGIGSLFGAGAAPAIDPVITGSIGGAGAAPAATAAAAPATGGLASLQAAGAAPGSILPAPAAVGPMGANIGAAAPLGPTAPIFPSPAGTLATPAGQSYAGTGTATIGPATNSTKVAQAIRAASPKIDPWAGAREVTTSATEAPKTGKGGIGGLLTMDKMLPLYLGSQMLSGLFKKGDKGGDDDDDEADKHKYNQPNAVFPDKDYNAGLREWNYYPNNRYANGGIVRLAQGGPVPGVDLQAQMPQDMSFPQNGIGSLVSPEQIPESPYPTSQTGTQPEPGPEDEISMPTSNDSELIAQTVEAIQGKIPNPEQIMLAFVKEFGEPALQDLMMRVQSMGQPGGPSDGTSDSIPAMIDGQQPAALSEGEYVVPADVVSGIGNGSTDAGARQLDQMVGGTRQMRNGGRVQPAGYSNGGIVGLAEGGQVKQMPSKIRELLQAMGDIPLEPSRIISSPEYENESIMPAWMDQYVPSVRGMAITGSPFATEQEMKRELRRREDPELRRRENARRK